MLAIIICLFLITGIGAQLNISDPLISLLSNFYLHPENLYKAIDFSFPDLAPQLFKQINQGTIGKWNIENTKSHRALIAQQYPKPDSTVQNKPSGWYDFIVVGAGTAGSIVASRLTENASISVLLLEAGGPENVRTDIPLGAFLPFLDPSPNDWLFVTEPQNNCFINMEEQRVRWARGKLMGGSSSINGMFYVRGFPKDYNNWANINGDSSWRYDNILQYFLKSEHNYDPEYCADTTYHNCNGLYPLVSHWKTNDNPVSRTVIKASAEFGINQVDLNRPQQPIFRGVNGVQQSIVNGSRVSSSKVFLESVHKNRQNLDIIALSFVTKIIFSDRKAIGVKYERSGVTYSVYARKEVILSAGSIKSPHILLTSGVGPRTQLSKFKIPVIANLPGVGENLHDHVFTIGLPHTLPSIGLWPTSVNSFLSYLLLREGPLAHFDCVQVLLSSSINTDLDCPDIQINSMTFPIGFEPTGEAFYSQYGLKIDVFKRMYFPHYLQPSFQFYSGLQRPKSRGNLYLNSSDPYVYPLLQPNYLSHPDDVKVLIEATRWLYRYGQTQTFKNSSTIPIPELTVGCESLYSLKTDNIYPNMLVPNDLYLECHIRRMTSILWHYVGTCKMGNVSDNMAVVDTQLRVLGGITGLRVIDSSIMPIVSTGNTNGPTMMIAEKGAQMIKNYYKI